MGENFDDDEWSPPTAADLKIIEARQERSNQISKLMGTYMLKGYRMLDRLCEHCGTILLQDRQRADYCVTCNELETECAKDDPALSSEAARAAALESQQSDKPRETPEPPKVTPNTDRLSLYGISRTQAEILPDSHEDSPNIPQSQGDENQGQPSLKVGDSTLPCGASANPNGTTGCTDNENEFSSTILELKNRISWATNELRNSASIESSIQLCHLVKACSEALVAINRVQNC